MPQIAEEMQFEVEKFDFRDISLLEPPEGFHRNIVQLGLGTELFRETFH
jgi:hypothetical protein